MKRVLCMLLCFAMTLGLCGCSQENKVKTMMDSFCKAVQVFDLVAMGSYMVNSEMGVDISFESSQDLALQEVMITYAGQIKYEIHSISIENDTAQVIVNFSYQDAAPVLASAMSDYLPQAFALAIGGADDQMLSDAFAGILLEKMETIETYECSESVAFHCVLIDGEWKIESADENIGIVLFSNMMSVLDGIGNSDDESENIDASEEPADEIIWNDVPMGSSAELATIKVTVTDCAETYSIISDGYTYTANEEAKYIVLTVKVENITKEPLYLDDETFPLYDSKGRHFDPYDDAPRYLDNIVYSSELSPNMPVEGIIIYHVPEDAADYYFAIAKRDTNYGYRFYGADGVDIFAEISYVQETEPMQSDVDIYEEDESYIEAYVKYGIGGGLNIRSGPGKENEKVGNLPEGERVIIWETQYVGDVEWGRIDQGWISMDYIQYDEPVPPLDQDSDSASAESYETDFFYVSLPAGWEEKYVLEHSYSARSEYVVFYYASDYAYYEGTYSEPGGWPFAIEIRADGTDCSAIAGWEHIGSIKVFEDFWYELYLHYPMDPQFMDGSYNSFLADARSIVDSIVAKDGYEIMIY